MKNITVKRVLFFLHLYSYYYVGDSKANRESDQAGKNQTAFNKWWRQKMRWA